MCGSIIKGCLLFLLTPLATAAQAGADSSAKEAAVPRVEATSRQLRLGFDISRLVFNNIYQNRTGYELMLDMSLRKDLYLVAEGGTGYADIDYDNLKYRTDNTFFRLGFDKFMFPRKRPEDWDGAFVGLRYGLGLLNRSEAWYRTDDGLGGVTTGTAAGERSTAHWFELTGGMRMELLPRVFAGWNLRGRFLLNQRSFGDLLPAYIAGYGPGDKQAVFDFNFYLCYALRWAKTQSGPK